MKYQMTKEIAHTILQQLGGRKFEAMTGAFNMGYDTESFSFKLPKCKDGINFVQIKYDYDADLYTIIFRKWNSKTLKLTTIKESVGMDVEQMRDHFTSMTGLYLTLGVG